MTVWGVSDSVSPSGSASAKAAIRVVSFTFAADKGRLRRALGSRVGGLLEAEVGVGSWRGGIRKDEVKSASSKSSRNTGGICSRDMVTVVKEHRVFDCNDSSNWV